MILQSSRIGVVVKKQGNKIIVGTNITLVKPGTSFSELKDNMKVTNENGDIVDRCGDLYLSDETIDPYHILIDWF